MWANCAIRYRLMLPNGFSNNIYGCCFGREGKKPFRALQAFPLRALRVPSALPHQSAIASCNMQAPQAPVCLSAEDCSISWVTALSRCPRDHQAQGFPFCCLGTPWIWGIKGTESLTAGRSPPWFLLLRNHGQFSSVPWR